MFFREPMELVCSFYFYYIEKYPNKSNLNIIDFIKENNIDHFYKVYLGSFEVDKIDFIGILEEYDTSIFLFEKIFKKKLFENRINSTKKKPNNYINFLRKNNFYDEVKFLMKENYNNNNLALKRFKL